VRVRHELPVGIQARPVGGKVVVVTGGGSGIGRCTAHELASLGAHVVLIGRKLEKLHAVAGEIVAARPMAAATWAM
jgi:NADP-dependent 3-hydroxy acid dehydrogenase YdfG